MPKSPQRKNESSSLKGWHEIADFLGQPTSVVQRWAKSGIPVTREGRRVHASPDELNRWLVDESAGEPVQIATDSTDLGAELKRGLSFVRKHTPLARKKRAA
jgi:phage terminase Nu1 subunit (DNA packaging protein)